MRLEAIEALDGKVMNRAFRTPLGQEYNKTKCEQLVDNLGQLGGKVMDVLHTATGRSAWRSW